MKPTSRQESVAKNISVMKLISVDLGEEDATMAEREIRK
jgi:hypothetical protein